MITGQESEKTLSSESVYMFEVKCANGIRVNVRECE